MNAHNGYMETLKMDTWRHSAVRSGCLALVISACLFAATPDCGPLDRVARRVGTRAISIDGHTTPAREDLLDVPSPRPYTVRVFKNVQDYVSGRRQDVIVVEFPQLQLDYVLYNMR